MVPQRVEQRLPLQRAVLGVEPAAGVNEKLEGALPDNLHGAGGDEDIPRHAAKSSRGHARRKRGVGRIADGGSNRWRISKPGSRPIPQSRIWIYDLRTHLHFTRKETTLKRSDLDDFVNCYFGQVGRGVPTAPEGGSLGPASPTLSRHNRKETERFKSFTYDELTKRDKVNLDIFWLKDDALEESADLPDPEIIAAEITADLEAAMEQFATIAEDLQ